MTILVCTFNSFKFNKLIVIMSDSQVSLKLRSGRHRKNKGGNPPQSQPISSNSLEPTAMNRLLNTQPVNKDSPGRVPPAIPAQPVDLTSPSKGPTQRSTTTEPHALQQEGTNKLHVNTSNEHTGSQNSSIGTDGTGNSRCFQPEP